MRSVCATNPPTHERNCSLPTPNHWRRNSPSTLRLICAEKTANPAQKFQVWGRGFKSGLDHHSVLHFPDVSENHVK